MCIRDSYYTLYPGRSPGSLVSSTCLHPRHGSAALASLIVTPQYSFPCFKEIFNISNCNKIFVLPGKVGLLRPSSLSDFANPNISLEMQFYLIVRKLK